MEQIIITHRNGTTLKLNSKENVSAITKATQTVELLGADIVDISVQSAKKMNFYIGDKITIIGRDYTLNTPAKERKVSENSFQYDLQFEGVQYDLLRATFNVNVNTTNNQIQDISGDSITGDIKLFLDVIVANANRVFGAGKWSVGTYPANSKFITLTFNDSDNCLTVLQNLCGESNFDTEFKIEINGSGNRTINIGATGNQFGHTFEYGRGKGIYELTREKQSSSNIVTRLNCFGGSKNIITPKYRAAKLCLPTKSKANSYVEDASAISAYGVWEGSKDFDDIYPFRVGTISALGATILDFVDSSMNFDLNEKNADGTTKYLMAGTSAKVHFNTGNLAGYEFDVTNYDPVTKQFSILAQTDQNDYSFPSTTSGAFQLSVGDEYVIVDIYMPQSYIDDAEARLLAAAEQYLAKYSQPLVQYGLTIDSFFLKNQVGVNSESNIIWVGDYIPIKDADLEVDKTIRVKGFSRDLMLDYSYQLTIADLSVTVSTINRVITGMNTVDKVIKINNLNDPARARKNWNYSQELLSMIFDPDGDYYTEKIKPLSIETSMLSVGSKSMQFGMVGTIFQPNYEANKNRVVYTGGVLTHYTITDANDNPRIWNIADGDVVMLSDSARYIYAKCSRSGNGGSILFTEAQLTVESDGAYYHFLIGILNSANADNTRALALTYGFTTINGRFIKTGRIQSAGGETYFDLDAGEFKGNFKFISGTSVESAVNDANANALTANANAVTAQNTANNIQVGGTNLLFNSAKFANTNYWASNGSTLALDTVNKYAGYNTLKLTNGGGAYNSNVPRLKADTEYTISALVKGSSALSGGYDTNLHIQVWTDENTSNVHQETSISFDNDITTGWKVIKQTFKTPASGSAVYCRFYFYPLSAGYNLNVAYVKLEKGNKASDWTPAPEDVDASIAVAQDSANSATTSAASALAKAAEADYLKAAMASNTSIEGGLMSTTLIQVKDVNGNVTGGLSGLSSDNIVLFGGGAYADAIQSANTPSAVAVIDRKDGSGHRAKGSLLWDKFGNLTVGLFKIVAGALTGYEGLSERIRITTQAITPLSTLIGGGWIREAKDYLSTNYYAGTIYNQYPNGTSKVATVTFAGTLVIPQTTNIRLHFGGALSYSLASPSGISNFYIGDLFQIVGVGTYSYVSGQVQTISVPAGSYDVLYTIEASFNLDAYKSSAVNLSNSTAAYIEVQSVTPSRTEIGNNGMLSFWSTDQYFFYDKVNGLEVKGISNIPGVLATGSISSAGAHSNRWGAKINTISAMYTANGIYDVYHTIGNTAYTVIVQPTTDGNNAFVTSKGLYSFRVQIRNNSGTAAAGAFDYSIMGTN